MRVGKPHFYWILILLLLLSGSSLAQDVTPSPTAEPAPLFLKVWLPDTLAAPENEAVQALFQNQTEAFASTQGNIVIETRLRSVGATGGIMSTLRTGSLVAQDALPTVTLLRRADLVSAQLGGLLHSMEGRIPSAVMGDLDTALQLGQVNSQLYGVPYMLDLQHVIYRPQSNTDYSQWSFDALLTRNQPFIFAAGRNGGLNDVVFLQYIAAGGQLNNEGQLVLNENALQTTFNFYESASDSGIIDGFTLNFFTPNDYVTAFVDGEFDAGIFTSSQYLNLYQTEHSLKIAPIPTLSGEPNAILNGWVWVVVAQEPRHQQLGLDYILWMLDPIRQAQIAQAVNMLPSRRSAMAEGLAGAASIEPFVELLDNAMLPITDSEGGLLTRTIQEALSSVLTLERSAEQAINFVLEQQTE